MFREHPETTDQALVDIAADLNRSFGGLGLYGSLELAATLIRFFIEREQKEGW